MVQPKTVVGFFDSISEAQQAVQLLLLSGFAKENLHMVTRTDLTATTTPTDEERQTGRFYFSLFGSLDNALIYLDISRRNGTFVTIHSVSVSVSEAELAVTLLKEAGSMEVREDVYPASVIEIIVVPDTNAPTWGLDQSMKFVRKHLAFGKQLNAAYTDSMGIFWRKLSLPTS